MGCLQLIHGHGNEFNFSEFKSLSSRARPSLARQRIIKDWAREQA